MENCVVEENNKSVEEFFEWYIDMIENYPNTFVHYLSEDALLQWFGRSIRGPERISYFIKTNLRGTRHNIYFQKSTPETEFVPIEENVSKSSGLQTPETKVLHESFVDKDAYACGDGPHIDMLPRKPDMSNNEIGQGDQTNFFEIKAALEFQRPCYKRGVGQAKWKRHCTLKIGYNGHLAEPLKFNIQLINYNDHIPCKRNLLPEFDKCLE